MNANGTQGLNPSPGKQDLRRWVFAIADDLTGALEVGARFAEQGIRASVHTTADLRQAPTASVAVFDTETRHLVPAESERIVRQICGSASHWSPWLVFKKTDSTLRGNIASELRAISDVWPERTISYVPAYPALGRTVVNGRLLVFGKAVHETEFAADALNPVHQSDIRQMLQGIRVIVVDGSSDGDVHAAASEIAALASPAAAGTGALAGAFAALLPFERQTRGSWPRIEDCLVINGSRHPVSRRQLEHAQQAGCLGRGWRTMNFDCAASGPDFARRLGERVRMTVEDSRPGGLIVFGGDTAYAIHQALGAPVFEPYGEVSPGVPLSRCGEMTWITKAGGFGPPDLLTQLHRKLT